MRYRSTPQESEQAVIERIAKDVLQEKYISIRLCEGFCIKESIKKNKTEISCKIEFKSVEKKSIINIKGCGDGPVDALFANLKKKLSKEYCSLETLTFDEFGVNADIQQKPSYVLNQSGSNASVEAVLVVGNDRGRELIFRNRSRSINKAAVNVVLQAIEYLINSEKAVLLLHSYIADARDRSRGDLLYTYTNQLSELVKNTSYEKIIERIKKEQQL